VRQLTGVELDKELQWTDWSKRPLSDRQLSYALNDVLYLLPCWAELESRLHARDRLSWVAEESTALTQSAVTRRAPEEAYQFVGGWNALKGKQLGSLRALAAWREQQALSTNKPPSWLIPDAAMVELSRKQANTERALRRARGLNAGLVADYGKEILDLIAKGAENPPSLSSAQEVLTSKEQALVAVVLGLIQARCLDEELPPRFAGSRADAEDLVRHAMRENVPEDSVILLAGWRRAMVGADALAWLRGQKALVTEKNKAGGLTLRPS
jgi:ribonuclease D